VNYDFGRLWKESFVACCLNKVYCIQHLVEVIEDTRRKLLDNLPTIAKFVEPFDKGCTNFREKKVSAVSKFFIPSRRHEANTIMSTLIY